MEIKVVRAFLPTFLAVVAYAVAFTPASAAWLRPCSTARLIASWKHDGLWRTPAVFDPPKYADGHKVRYLGKVHAAGRAYNIYYDENSDPATETRHSHTDLVVTSSGGRFLGLYEIMDEELEPPRVKGADVLFNSSKAYGDRIHFGPKGPPHKVLLNENDVRFSTPAEFREYFPDLKPWPERGPRVADYCRLR